MANSKADKTRLQLLHDMPCLCCESMRVPQPFRTEAHHIVRQSYRSHGGGDQATVPLCSFHHRGLCEDGMTGTQMEAKYGPSMFTNKRKFQIVFGTELELLEQTNKLLDNATCR